jgi:hypothetical protein
MRDPRRQRIDYMPGPAALAVLEHAQERFPDHSQQAMIDRLLIIGYSALLHQHWQPPALHGRNRLRWRPDVR